MNFCTMKIEIYIISINFEKANTSDKWLVVDEEKGQHALKCKICGDTFMFKKGETEEKYVFAENLALLKCASVENLA